jgi:hypothetical protein
MSCREFYTITDIEVVVGPALSIGLLGLGEFGGEEVFLCFQYVEPHALNEVGGQFLFRGGVSGGSV